MQNSKAVYLESGVCATYECMSIEELSEHKLGDSYIIPLDAVMDGIVNYYRAY